MAEISHLWERRPSRQESQLLGSVPGELQSMDAVAGLGVCADCCLLVGGGGGCCARQQGAGL